MSVADLNLQSFYPPELSITGIEESDNEIIIHMHSTSRETIYHKCGSTLIKYHGTHRRKVQDLPILGKRVQLILVSNLVFGIRFLFFSPLSSAGVREEDEWILSGTSLFSTGTGFVDGIVRFRVFLQPPSDYYEYEIDLQSAYSQEGLSSTAFA